MRIGIDFDNTIVCYDGLFHRLAVGRGLIDADTPVTKSAVREALCDRGREDLWTELQGEAYGRRINEAEAFPGVRAFIVSCRRAGHRVFIISHKTRRPFAGPDCDLHVAARLWLRGRGIVGPEADAIDEADVFLELTLADKLRRIGDAGCSCFIDDLPQCLRETAFPPGVEKLLFDPHDRYAEKVSPRHADGSAIRRARSWDDLSRLILDGELVS